MECGRAGLPEADKQVCGQGSPSREGRYAKWRSKLTLIGSGKTMHSLVLAFPILL
jgi:hypothetical protein